MIINENGFEIDVDKCFRDIAMLCTKRAIEVHGQTDDPFGDVIAAASIYFGTLGRLSTLTEDAIKELILLGE